MPEVAEPIIKRTQVVVGAPKPAAEPEKVKLPETDAELEARRSNVMAAMWGPTKKVEAIAPATEPPVEPQEPAAATPATLPPEPAAPTTPPAAVPAAVPVDPEALIAKTAAKIGEEVGRAMDRKAAPDLEPEPEPELTPEDARDAEIIAKMEELDPSLKGRSEAFKAFALARYDYETDWREKHPGETFNPDDDEHAEFYKGQPEIEPEAFEAAKIELLVDRKVSQRVKPIEEKSKADERRDKTNQAIAKAAPKITATVSEKILQAVGNVSADVAALMKDMNPLALKPEEIAKLEEADPTVSEVMGPMVMGEMVPMLIELEKSVAPDAEYTLDPVKNPVHAEIAKYLVKFEDAMAAKPETRNGRDFMTLADMNRRVNEIFSGKGSTESKERKLADLQSRYWTATVDDIQKTIVSDVSVRAKAAVDRIDGIGKRKYGGGLKPAAAKSAASPAPPEPTPQPAINGKPKPPTVASQATVVDTSRSGKPAEKSFGEIAVATHWGS